MDTSGFYKKENETLLYGPNFVEHKDFKLERQLHETYTYPIHDWYWFNSEDEARLFFNLPKPQDPPMLPQWMYDPFNQE